MNQFLKSILDGLHTFIPSYGWCVVAFTILVRMCLLPLDYKSRLGMRKMSKLAPKQAALQKKYQKDPEKMQRKLAELYKQERVSPMSGCWPLLVSMPIMIAMFTAMRMMANEQLAQQAFDIILNGEPRLEGFLWVKNLWMPDSPFQSAWPSIESLKLIESREWVNIFETLSKADIAKLSDKLDIALKASSFKGDNLESTLKALTTVLQKNEAWQASNDLHEHLRLNLLIWQPTVRVMWNGLFLLPLMSAVSQYLMTVLNPTNNQPAPTADGQQKPAGGGFMKWFFPLFSLWLCCSYNAAFATYWVTSNLIAMAQNWGINKYLDAKEKKAADAQAQGTVK